MSPVAQRAGSSEPFRERHGHPRARLRELPSAEAVESAPDTRPPGFTPIGRQCDRSERTPGPVPDQFDWRLTPNVLAQRTEFMEIEGQQRPAAVRTAAVGAHEQV